MGKFKRTLFRATRVTALIASVSLAVQFYLTRWHQAAPLLSVFDHEMDGVEQHNGTLWEVLLSKPRLSRCAAIVGDFPQLVAPLNTPNLSLTVFAPTDEAFAREFFHWDSPWFFYIMLASYHIAPGELSREALQRKGTVGTVLNADIFWLFKQRISTQRVESSVMLNYLSTILGPEQAAVNGRLHYVDRVLTLPESTSHVLRSSPEFRTFCKGLTVSEVAVVVNDTSTHVGQTVFAPTNAAFKKLGHQVNRFLFGPGGEAYLKALMEYHVVANHTLFSDVYFHHTQKQQIDLTETDVTWLPTLAPGGFNLSVTIEKHDSQPAIRINNAVTASRPDIVVMDGVIHAVETVLIPPGRQEALDGQPGTMWDGTVDSLVARLQPLIE
ncbi:hypothetical protein ASPZODRAFT_138219 [Penicilliopsis zonata CBS 506.65]|uniref:FAS1 domain-containing protein n=1 Tax=Penicilliopsis zonata CBS 506.65 TaxID=1073090 RepID=A0A1L9SV81_9EURO|nr:hypothetical protein ASPZODRAFT_138219 [Penicilliopsis zonata CBS 506.65]OJJ51098.1 hypothetical protein ASPZODRAFT_138219 [Penicilliopsis zonata CBS 506.65]